MIERPTERHFLTHYGESVSGEIRVRISPHDAGCLWVDVNANRTNGRHMALHLNDHEVDGLIATLRYLKEVSSHIHSEENNIDNDEEIYKYHHERNAPMTTEPIYDEHGDLPTGHITLQPSSSGDAIWFDVVSYGHDMEDRYYRMPRDTVTLHLPHDSAEALISELRKIIDAE